MIVKDTAIESILQEAYNEEARHYTQAVTVADRILVSLQQGESTSECFEHLQVLFQQIATVEVRLIPLRKDSERGGALAHPHTLQAKEEVIALIQQLVHRISECEQIATSMKDNLSQSIDVGIRVRRMQQAYGQGT